MKTNEIFKVNGKTFNSYEDVVEYNKENNYRVTNTTTRKFGKKVVNFIDVSSIY